MDFNSLVSAMAPETYQKLADAVAIGRWADGTLLTEQQKEQTLQLVMAYQAKILRSEELFTIGANGQMIQKTKAELKKQFTAPDAIARFTHDDI